MSSVQKLKRRAMEFEQKRQLDRALDLYVQLLDEAGRDLPDDDVPLYNRVGDLLVRKGDTAQALAYYERAVDAYAERGFLNNAIALCNKILRQSPGRTSIYYKLGKISARKGFRSDARKNFLEYADRMQKSGNLDEAFRALKEFAALYPEQDDIRLTLADLLSRENRKGEALEQLAALYEKYETEGRKVEARATIDRMRAIDPEAEVPTVTGEQSAVQGPDTLVFLDVTGDEPRRAPAPTPRRESPISGPTIPGLQGLRLTFVPEAEEPPAAPPEADARPDDVPDEEPAPGERTDELDVVAAEAGHDRPASDEQPTHEPDQSVDVEAAAPDVDVLPDEDERRLLEQHPLSGVEFADLPLTEVQRAEASRSHDLVVPTALPHLGDPARNGEAAGSDDIAEAAAGEDEISGEVDIVEDFPPIDGLLVGQRDFLPDEDEGDADEPPRATYRPTPTDGERLTIPSPEELLETPPSFGRTEPIDGHGFPPLPGLTDDSDSVSVPDDAFIMEDTYGRLTPIDSPSPIEFDEAPAQEFAPTGHEEAVDAPVPDGLAAAAEATEPPEQVATATPRVTLSLGGAEGHLRQRIELDPENWALHRQLGEVLLDAGDRAGGLESLERAMSGFETAGELEDANEVADVVLRVHPNSIRHHQKRVEYAVRLKDRARLAAAYLELADALFRTGEGDKSIAVYARVAELDPDNERALFALATLAPERVEALRGKPARRDRWSDELDAFPEGLASLPLPAAPPEPARKEPRPEPDRVEAEDQPPAYETVEGSWADAPAPAEDAPDGGEGPLSALPEVPEGFESTALAFETDVPEQEIRREDSPTPASPEPFIDRSAASAPDAPADFLPLVEDLLGADDLDDAAATPPAPADETPATILPIEAFAPQESAPADVPPAIDPPVEMPPAIDTARARATREAEPPPAPAPRPAPPKPDASPDASSEYFDLGDWLRDSEAPRSTRMVVEDARPTGDEQADFEELLRRFKRGLAENVDEEDFEAHYDLGVAFKEMGLIDEAIAEFQKALRGSTHRIKAYEALGACFVEKSQYPIAAALLQRAIELPGTDDQQLVGVLYLLGFASEQLGRHADALRYYQRVFAVDIDFRDVRQRVSAMEHLTK